MMFRADVEHLRSVFMAVENGDIGMLKSLGIKVNFTKCRINNKENGKQMPLRKLTVFKSPPLYHTEPLKGQRFSRPEKGCHLPNSPCLGIIKIF